MLQTSPVHEESDYFESFLKSTSCNSSGLPIAYFSRRPNPKRDDSLSSSLGNQEETPSKEESNPGRGLETQ